MAERNTGPIFSGPGDLGDTSTGWLPWTHFNQVLSIAVGVVTGIAIIWFLFLLITGAIAFMQSGGDQAKADEARKKLTTGVVGIIIVIAAIFAVDFVGYFLGFDILNPGNFLMNLTI